MAEITEVKDKIVTVESLSAVHNYNKDTYMPMDNPVGSGTMTIDGDGSFSGSITIDSLMIGSNVKLVATENSLEIVFLDEEELEEELIDN